MNSRTRFFLSAGFACAVLSTAAALAEKEKPSSPSTEADAPAQMKPVSVNTVFVSITLRPFYRDSAEGLRLSRLMIEDVRAKSLAARAGLVVGMEILAIQGTVVSGLREVELQKLCEAPVTGDTLLLNVADPPLVPGSAAKPRDIRVPLAKTPADKPREFTIPVDPNKRRPDGAAK